MPAELPVENSLFLGVVLITQDAVTQTGFLIGPTAIATAAHGLERGRAVTVRYVGSGLPADNANILFCDYRLDLCVLAVRTRHKFWLTPHLEPLVLHSNHLVVSCTEEEGQVERLDRVETTTVVHEGLVQKGSRSLIKLGSGQIKAGYSGSAVLTVDSGRLVGMICQSREVSSDLGGHAVSAADIQDVRDSLQLDSDDRRMEILRVTTGMQWPVVQEVLGTSLPRGGIFVGREDEIDILDARISRVHHLLYGAPGSGKTALIGIWIKISSWPVGKRAYIDLSRIPDASSSHPVLGRVLVALDTEIPRDGFGDRTPDETAALACFQICRRLPNGRLAIDFQELPITDFARKDLTLLAAAADGENIVVAAAARACDNGVAIDGFSDLALGPLDPVRAIELICLLLPATNVEEVKEAIYTLVDHASLLPGKVIDACESESDVVDLCVALSSDQNVSSPGPRNLESVSGRDDPVEAVIASAKDPLGITVPIAERGGVDSDTFIDDAALIDEWRGTEPIWLTSSSLTTDQAYSLRQISHRVSGRAMQSKWVESLYAQILDLEARSTDDVPLETYISLWSAQLAAGNIKAAENTLNDVGGLDLVSEIISDSAHLEDLNLARVVILAWWMGKGDSNEIGQALSQWMSAVLTRAVTPEDFDVRVALHDGLRSISARRLPDNDALELVASWCLSNIEDTQVFLRDPGQWTRFVSLIGRALDFSGEAELARTFLSSAVESLSRNVGALKNLARAGDARPLLTIARQQRRLSRIDRGRRSRSDRMSSAEEILDWVVLEAPSADAFLTWLANDRALHSGSSVGSRLEGELPANDQAKRRLASLRRKYRDWRKNRHGVDRDIVQLEYGLLRAEWAISGSLLRVAREADGRWVHRPVGHRLEVLDRLAEDRRDRLARLSRWLGVSVHSIEFEATLELQYQTAIAVVAVSPVQLGKVIDVLDWGGGIFPDDAHMHLLNATHWRQCREFLVSADWYAKAFASAVADPLVRTQAAVGRCESISQAYAMGQCDRQELVDAMEYVQWLESTDYAAAVVGAMARLELNHSLAPAFDDLAELVAQTDSFAEFSVEVGNPGEWFNVDVEAADHPDMLEDSLFYRFLSDFTDVGVLTAIGAMLVRAEILDPAPGLVRLKAALILLDGVRTMAGVVWNSPSVSFHQARALLYACRRSDDPNPIGWDDWRERDDIDAACARFQSAHDLSVGTFRTVIREHLDEAQEVRRRFRRGR